MVILQAGHGGTGGRSMRVEITTTLDIAPQRAWHEVQTAQLLMHIAAPLVTFEPIAPRVFPTVWQEQKYLVTMKVLGFIPFGKHTINISMPHRADGPGQHLYHLRDNGSGDLITTWDHLITIKGTADGKTHYTDRVDIRAGVLTPLVWLFASIFYRYRQHRWRRLVRTNFAYPH
jgi:hypothetical protein